MKIKNYQQAAQRTSRGPHDRTHNGALGLVGEAGEVVDIIKKQKFQGLPTATAKQMILDELGDVLWYIAEACAGIGRDIAEVDFAAEGVAPKGGTLERRAVRLVAAACDLDLALGRMELAAYAPTVAFPRLAAIYRLVLDICDILEADIEDVASRNVKKLRRRYLSGFDAEISSARYEEAADE